MSFRFDREKTRKNIGLILDDIKTRADPRLLDEYRRAFKREVSFFRRSWAAAYLLMLYDQDGLRGNAPGQGRRPSLRRKPADPAGRAEEARQARPPIEALPEEEARQLFINIGRSRRVFPREILGLIYSKASVSREDIGSIRIMDNYSFIQARDSVADTIIEALNGKSFRGKVLTVNYARPRREEGDDDAESQAGSRAESGENGSFPAEDAGGFETLAGDSEQGDDHPDEEGV